MDLAPFPDIEDLLVQALADLTQTGTVYPPDLERQLPFTRVRRVGGGDDRRTDTALVEVETAAGTRAQAWEMARKVQQRLTSGPLLVPGAGVMDRAQTEFGLRGVLHDNPKVRCVLATYSVSARRTT
ncbi:phage tail termination protein [Streptomyces sp. NPDC004069]